MTSMWIKEGTPGGTVRKKRRAGGRKEEVKKCYAILTVIYTQLRAGQQPEL